MSRNVENLQKDIKLGNPLGYTDVEKDGTMVAKGNATCWNDITGDLISKRLTSTSGKLDYNYDENTISMQRNGDPSNPADVLMVNIQIPHDAKPDTLVKLHMHWWQESTLSLTMLVKYRIQNNGNEKSSTWNEVTVNFGDGTGDVFPYTSGTLNQITELVTVHTTGCNISDTIQFQLCRTDSSNITIETTYIDAHYEVDMLGSHTEFIK